MRWDVDGDTPLLWVLRGTVWAIFPIGVRGKTLLKNYRANF